MARPRKRPRLQLIGSASPEPDFELEVARKQNDQLLKSRWESIFERYGKDFTGIGDEIGNLSGQIEVDNGHIRNMQDELDTGEDGQEISKFDGRRMLRAMTVAPDDYSGSVSEDEHVFESIETITDNAMLSDLDSEDEFMEDPSRDSNGRDRTEQHTSRGITMSTRRARSSSPDSLFDVADSTGQLQADVYAESEPEPETEPLDLRAQVRLILQEEKEQALEQAEEKIEPAWRLPTFVSSITPATLGTSLPARNFQQRSYSESEGLNHESLEEKYESKQKRRKTAISSKIKVLHTKPSGTRKSQKAVAAKRNMMTIRADSEDPLQEGFTSTPSRQLPSKARPHKGLEDPREGDERTNRSGRSRSAKSSTHLDVSDAEFVASEEEELANESEFGSDLEEYELNAGRKRATAMRRPSDRKALLTKYKRKSASKSNSKPPGPRFSAPETDADKTTHPWHAPATRDGKPVDFKSAAQRKGLNAKFAVSNASTKKDPVSAKLQRDKVLKPMEKGICVYCNNNHTNKNGVGSHWDRVLTNFVAETLDKNDPHDIEFIHEIRKQVERRIRPPVTRLVDFTTMVKMHEGQQKSFEEILKSNLLYTTKSAPQIEKEFHVWRRDPGEAQVRHQWTDRETAHLRELMNEAPQSSRHSLTLIRIHRLVGAKSGMDYPDVGNKIADLIMEDGDFAVRLPTQSWLATEQGSVRSTSEHRQSSATGDEQLRESIPQDKQLTVQDEVDSLVDPAILRESLLQDHQVEPRSSIEITSETAVHRPQAHAALDASGTQNLYQQLASYANEHDIRIGQAVRPPIDVAPRY